MRPTAFLDFRKKGLHINIRRKIHENPTNSIKLEKGKMLRNTAKLGENQKYFANMTKIVC
jgi:hypothetical protein